MDRLEVLERRMKLAISALPFVLILIGILITNHQFRQSSFAGFIVNKNVDSHARLRKNIVIQGRDEDICIENDKLYDTIHIGDYIIKRKGSWNYLLVTGKDTLVYEEKRW